LQALHTLLHSGVKVVHCQGAVLVDGYFHYYFSFRLFGQPFGQAAEPQAARCTAKVPIAINVMLGGAGAGSRNIGGKFDKKEKKKEKK